MESEIDDRRKNAREIEDEDRDYGHKRTGRNATGATVVMQMDNRNRCKCDDRTAKKGTKREKNMRETSTCDEHEDDARTESKGRG